MAWRHGVTSRCAVTWHHNHVTSCDTWLWHHMPIYGIKWWHQNRVTAVPFYILRYSPKSNYIIRMLSFCAENYLVTVHHNHVTRIQWFAKFYDVMAWRHGVTSHYDVIITWHRVTSRDITWHRVTSCDMPKYGIMWWHRKSWGSGAILHTTWYDSRHGLEGIISHTGIQIIRAVRDLKPQYTCILLHS